MLNLKKNNDQDIDSLIESMLRLIEYMSNNPTIKRQIFESFNLEDLTKILKNLNEKKSGFLRKVSCIFLCTVLQDSENCERFMRINDLLPINSKIAINGIPENIGKYINAELLQKLHSVQECDDSLCWYYSYQMAKDRLPNLAYFQLNQKDLRKQINDFIDPLDCMIGVKYRQIPTRVPKLEIQTWANKSENYHKMSVSPVSKQNITLVLPLKEIENPKYYKRYVAKSMNQQQCLAALGKTGQIRISNDKSPPKSELIRHKQWS